MFRRNPTDRLRAEWMKLEDELSRLRVRLTHLEAETHQAWRRFNEAHQRELLRRKSDQAHK